MEPFLWFLTLSFSLLLHSDDVTGTTCGPVDPITGGRSSSPPRPRPGSVLEYHCPAGFRPFPVAWRVCMQSGRWSPLRNAQRERSQTAHCRPYRCVSPMLLEHGYFQPRLLQYRVNQTVQFICNQGFALLGSPTRTCLSNGRWSGNAAICYAGGVHIYFLLDASGSVGEENFQKTLEFVTAFSEKKCVFPKKGADVSGGDTGSCSCEDA
ncbi:complement C2-like [Hypanus sabinus]|uniref:complement C2-like n=1 Tax=Hypanus sabinus TaxID=79690 RepID=UPI0028C4C3B5|nr:complement C2-like [Hypanus sabinus]